VTSGQFSRDQRKLVFRATDEAEQRASDYYCIPPHGWNNLRYDLVTREDRDWEPLPDESILARVQHIENVIPVRARKLDFYRIQLNDPTILCAAERESLTPDLYPFLVFIITHEMVHLIRLSSILDDPRFRPVSAEEEEARVQRVSRQILLDSGYSKFEPIMQKFCISAPAGR
jgi:hypothetical protein